MSPCGRVPSQRQMDHGEHDQELLVPAVIVVAAKRPKSSSSSSSSFFYLQAKHTMLNKYQEIHYKDKFNSFDSENCKITAKESLEIIQNVVYLLDVQSIK